MYCFRSTRLFPWRNVNLHHPNFTKSVSHIAQNNNSNRKLSNQMNFALRLFHDFEVNSRVQDNYRNSDKVPKEFEIIYRAPLANYIKVAHYTSTVTAVIMPSLSIFYVIFNGPLIFPVQFGSLPLIRDYFDFTIFYLGLFLMVGQILAIVSQYPIRLYTDRKGSYTAIYRGIFPWTLTKKTFKAGELSKISSIMPWGDSLYKIKSKKAILIEDHFLRPVDLTNMLEQKSDDHKE